VADVRLINLAQMAQSLSGCLLVSVLVTKSDGSHAPWLNV
jgi:hypothetical protein